MAANRKVTAAMSRTKAKKPRARTPRIIISSRPRIDLCRISKSPPDDAAEDYVPVACDSDARRGTSCRRERTVHQPDLRVPNQASCRLEDPSIAVEEMRLYRSG